MTHEPNNPTPDAQRDRLVESALEEQLGGYQPRDLSDRIQTLANECNLAAATGVVTMASDRTRSFGLRTWVLAASLLVNAGLLAALIAAQGNAAFHAARSADSQPKNEDQTVEASSIDDASSIDNAASSKASPTEPSPTDLHLYDGRAPAEEAAGEFPEFSADLDIPSRQNSFASGPQPGQSGEGQAGDAPADGPTASADNDSDAGIATNFSGLNEESLPRSKSERAGNYHAGLSGEQAGDGQAAEGQRPSPYYLQDDVQYYAPGPEFAKAPSRPGHLFRSGESRDAGVDQDSDGATLTVLPAEDYSSPYREAEVWESLDGRREKFRTVDLGGKEIRNFGIDAITTDVDGRLRELQQEYSRLLSQADVVRKEQSIDEALARDPRLSIVQQEVLALQLRVRDAQRSSNGRPTRELRRLEKQLSAKAEQQDRLVRQLRDQWHGSPDGEGIGPGAAGDRYERIHENPFVPAMGAEAVSTFSIDVDTASYANVRQMLQSGHLPPPDAVRIEELVNYFEYKYEPPTDSMKELSAESAAPFAAHVETAGCPWNADHRLVRIAVKGRELDPKERPQSNLVFLVDVSGSMSSPEKLPLVKYGLRRLADQLGEKDRVAIVVYASQEGLALDSTPGSESATIVAALNNLQSGGSTAGGAGIRLAYQIAQDNFIEGSTNRVILCTDGDFNVGTTSTAELERLVEEKAKDTGVFLSAIGFGRGNLNDAMMEKITGIGNGNYYYVDAEQEAERVFVKGMTGMLVTIAKDVKIQVEFNPAKVAGYRLLGYENRMLETRDFNDDTKDAGEIGAGHTVTCLYEIVPAGKPVDSPETDELKYQVPTHLSDAAETGEMLTLKMRYKQPEADTSSKLEWPITDDGQSFGEASTDLQFAASVAGFGMLLRDSQYKGDATFAAMAEIADSARGKDPAGDRSEFVELIRTAKRLMPEPEVAEDE